ncbi:hypothetical protein [Deinococcus hopiensis]|uniref:hypothetical protein n=1 Tax=Deinococcus hopiensis TaxID=309885 RepID=UPI000A035B6E|nr:hypothetical protein [Deinococcus hopiensis]
MAPSASRKAASPAEGPARPVFLTRLHVRSTRATFPQDLYFKITQNQDAFQGRYVLRRPFSGTSSCKAATAYRTELKARAETQAQNLAHLTGWNVNHLRKRMLEVP